MSEAYHLDEDPNGTTARVERSRKAVEATMARLASSAPSVSTRSSPIEALLLPFADQIREARERGWSDGQIAKALQKSGVQFGADSIRLRLGKMFGRSKHRSRQTPAPPNAKRISRATEASSERLPLRSGASEHAGFDEDPK